MSQNKTSCVKCVDDGIAMVKNGKTPSGKQRFKCKICGRTRVETYRYNAYHPKINNQIIRLTKEGLGIRSTARVLKISATTLLKRIVAIAKDVRQPVIVRNKIYEVDEMRSYIGRKDEMVWIVYALERNSKSVVSLNVGRRTNRTLQGVLHTLQNSEPVAIYTDGLKHYKYLIDRKIHITRRFGTNNIERMNLTLRTHLKRLNRRTICFSRSKLILVSVLKIYFWA